MASFRKKMKIQLEKRAQKESLFRTRLRSKFLTRRSSNYHTDGHGVNPDEDEEEEEEIVDESQYDTLEDPDYTNEDDEVLYERALAKVKNILTKLGLYRHYRQQFGGYQKTKDYCSNVVKQTSRFLLFVGGKEFYHQITITESVIRRIVTTVLRTLHLTAIPKYSISISKDFSPSKSVSCLK